MNWLRPALFSSLLTTSFGDDLLQRTLYNVGGQVDFRLVLFSNLESTFSLGYAIAVENDQKPSHEFMASIKIL